MNGIYACEREKGACLNCQDGKHGPFCDKECSFNCELGVGGLARLCNQSDGICTRGCKAGWYGVYCNERCNTQCTDNNGLVTCDRYSGSCACRVGFYGATCDQNCSVNCDVLKNEPICEKESGNCSQGCKLPPYDTWFTGSHCNLSIGKSMSLSLDLLV